MSTLSQQPLCFYRMANRFLSSSEFSATTVRTYKTALSSFFGWMRKECVPLPRREDVVAWKEALKRHRSLGTAQTYLAAVRLFFKWTGQYGIYPDIASSVKGVKVGRLPKRDYLAPHQVVSVLRQARNNPCRMRDYAMILLMVTCGLRVSEVAQADVADLCRSGRETILYIHGKGRDGKTDFVNVPKKVEQEIRRYLKTRPGLQQDAPLFAAVSRNNPGGRMTSHSISRIVKDAMRAAGYDCRRLTAHSLRHTAVTISLEAGATLQQVQQFARHSLIVTTQIYAHNLEQSRNPCSSKIARLIAQYDTPSRRPQGKKKTPAVSVLKSRSGNGIL